MLTESPILGSQRTSFSVSCHLLFLLQLVGQMCHSRSIKLDRLYGSCCAMICASSRDPKNSKANRRRVDRQNLEQRLVQYRGEPQAALIRSSTAAWLTPQVQQSRFSPCLPSSPHPYIQGCSRHGPIRRLLGLFIPFPMSSKSPKGITQFSYRFTKAGP